MSKAWSKDMKLDPGTFGGSPACHILVDMMNNNIVPVSEKHRILSFINDAILQFKELSVLKNYSIKERIMVLVKNDLTHKIDLMPYPEKFNSHLKNVISCYFRRYLSKAKELDKKYLKEKWFRQSLCKI